MGGGGQNPEGKKGARQPDSVSVLNVERQTDRQRDRKKILEVTMQYLHSTFAETPS